ncbi:hypothetical protein JCM10296v2_006118 [Rhodotorula toruloides]
MPVPPLPLELVDLIISHIARDLPQAERLAECGRLALVCSNWANAARTVAYHRLEVHSRDTPQIIGHLLENPHLSCYIRDFWPTVPWTIDLNLTGHGQLLLNVLRLTRLTDVNLPISPYTRKFFLAAVQELDTACLRNVACVGSMGSSDILDDLSEGLRCMPCLRSLTISVGGADLTPAVSFSNDLGQRITTRDLIFTVLGAPDSGTASGLFRAVCSMLTDVLRACHLRVRDASALSLAPLVRFSNLTAVGIGIESDSAGLYRLCDELAALPHIADLYIWHRVAVGEVYRGSDIRPNVVDVIEVLRRLPITLVSAGVAGWTIRPHITRFLVHFQAERIPGNLHQVRFCSETGGETLATYVKATVS